MGIKRKINRKNLLLLYSLSIILFSLFYFNSLKISATDDLSYTEETVEIYDDYAFGTAALSNGESISFIVQVLEQSNSSVRFVRFVSMCGYKSTWTPPLGSNFTLAPGESYGGNFTLKIDFRKEEGINYGCFLIDEDSNATITYRYAISGHGVPGFEFALSFLAIISLVILIKVFRTKKHLI